MHSKTVETVDELKALWRLLFSGVLPPEDAQWALWLLRHNAAIVQRGLTELATKHRKLNGAMDDLYMAKFASTVMNRLGREQSQKGSTAP